MEEVKLGKLYCLGGRVAKRQHESYVIGRSVYKSLLHHDLRSVAKIQRAVPQINVLPNGVLPK